MSPITLSICFQLIEWIKGTKQTAAVFRSKTEMKQTAAVCPGYIFNIHTYRDKLPPPSRSVSLFPSVSLPLSPSHSLPLSFLPSLSVSFSPCLSPSLSLCVHVHLRVHASTKKWALKSLTIDVRFRVSVLYTEISWFYPRIALSLSLSLLFLLVLSLISGLSLSLSLSQNWHTD